MTQAVGRALKIRPGEGRLLSLLFALWFTLGVSFNFLETAAFPLFLTSFDAQTLPYVYIINAVVVATASLGYLRLGDRLGLRRQLVLNLTILAVLLLAAWLGLTLSNGSDWLIFALPILFQLIVTIGPIGFWTLAARLTTLRQSKRLFGVISAGLWIAIILTGLIIPFVVQIIGTTNLLLISAAAMVVRS